jgi:hypothetical protein
LTLRLVTGVIDLSSMTWSEPRFWAGRAYDSAPVLRQAKGRFSSTLAGIVPMASLCTALAGAAACLKVRLVAGTTDLLSMA